MPMHSLFSSGRGAVLTMVGVAIGLGNIWRFPYMMGQYGGSVFLIVYLVVVFAFGVPALMAEWALGRHTRRGTWGVFTAAGMRGGRLWSTVLVVSLIMAASYYAVVIGWVLQELAACLKAAFAGGAVDSFAVLTDSLAIQMFYLGITVLLACVILGLGVRRGIERVSRVATPGFFVLFLVLIVRVLTLDGAIDGLRQFMQPKLANFSGRTALAALGQAMFSLGLGGTFVVRYGSYSHDDEDIPRQSILTSLADVGAALMAALIIVPAVLAFGMDVQGGPSLMFEALPRVFSAMAAGPWFGAAFFLSVFAVALLSLVAAYQVIATALEEGLGWSRRRALVSLAVLELGLAVPAYRVGGYIGISDLIWGTTMQPFGAGIAVIALCWCVGRGRALEQLRRNTTVPVPGWLFMWMKYVLPAVIFAVLIYGWTDWWSQR